MRAHWKLVVLAMVGCLFGSYACVEAVSLGDSDERLTVAMPPWPPQFGATADLPTSGFGPLDSLGRIPGSQRPYPVPGFSAKGDPLNAGHGRVTFMLVPTTWDARFMLIPTQWDAEIIFVSTEYDATQCEVSVLKMLPTANKPRGPVSPDQLR